MKALLKSLPHGKYERIVLALCLAAGIFYNSWPLGYILDNSTARHGLASDLELPGHPYYRLFITCDVLTAVCLVAAVLILLLRSNIHIKVLVGLTLFGLGIAAGALLPAGGPNHGSGPSLDVITSTIAAIGLFISLTSVALEAHKHQTATLSRITWATLAAWLASSLLFTMWALTKANAHTAQDVYLILSGLAIFVIGLNLDSYLT